jgi:hypothetical protein
LQASDYREDHSLDQGVVATFGRSEFQFNTCISENEVRCRELFKPETSFATRIAELIVRRQYHHYFQVPSPLSLFMRFSCGRSGPTRSEQKRWSRTIEQGIARYVRIGQ